MYSLLLQNYNREPSKTIEELMSALSVPVIHNAIEYNRILKRIEFYFLYRPVFQGVPRSKPTDDGKIQNFLKLWMTKHLYVLSAPWSAEIDYCQMQSTLIATEKAQVSVYYTISLEDHE